MKNFLFLLAVVLPLFLSCRPRHQDAGPVVTEERIVPFFSAVSVYGDAHVTMNTDSLRPLRVEAPRYILPHVHTVVSGSHLRIEETGHSYRHRQPVKIYVPGPYYSGITAAGSGDLFGRGLLMTYGTLALRGSGQMDLQLHAAALRATLGGSGDMRLSGTTSQLDISLQGSGTVKAADMRASRVDVSSYGSGNVYVQVTDTLYVTGRGSGNVYYQGNPSVIQVSLTGSGTVQPY